MGQFDWDEPRSQPGRTIVVGEPLATLSIADLEARIAALEAEIARVRTETDARRRHEAAAAALFRKD